MEASTKNIYSLLFFLFFLSYGYFFQGGGWNQNSRVCLTRAVLHQHSFIIDQYKEDFDDPYFEFVNTGDWAYYNNHYYTNKAPGLSFMAVPPFGIAEYIFRHIFPADTERQVLLATYFSTLCTTVLCSALLCLLLFHTANRFLKFSMTGSLLLAVSFGFGTLAFSYSTTLYCHLPAAFFSFLSFVLAMHIKLGRGRLRLKALSAGLAASTAVLVEPSSVFILVCVFLYLLSFRRGRSCFLFFLLGCIPPGMLQCFYNAACFGGPFASSYLYSNNAVMWKIDGRLFGPPSLKTLVRLLVLPHRGLFYTSPILLMSLPGMVLLFRKGLLRAEALVCSGSALVFLLFIAGTYAWHGGSAAGPRYLLPAYPFIFFLAMSSLAGCPKLFKTLAVLSVVINLAITLVGNEIPLYIQNPVFDVVLDNIMEGTVSVNPVPVSNFTAYPDVQKLARVENWPLNFNSFNLGEILFPHSIASLLPLTGMWIIWCLLWMYIRRRLL